MKKVDIISNIVARKGEAMATPSKVKLSGYLLKSIWDKVFEIRTDSQGSEYIFGKLPMVIQYGISMYSGDGVDVPSLASGLPFDGRTIWYNPDTQQIEVIGGTGGTGGGGLDITALQNYLTQNSYLNVTSGDNRYLKLSGGTITGRLRLEENVSGDALCINDPKTTQGVKTIRFERNGDDYFGINWFHDGYNGYNYNTNNLNIGSSTGYITLGLWTSPFFLLDIEKRMIGIGKTNPSFALDVNGSIRASTYVKVGAQPDSDFPNFINAATTYSGWHTLLGCNGRGFIFGQDREDSTIAKIQPYGSTTAFRYTKIESAVEISNAISTAPASIRFCMNQGGGKDGNANIEFMTGTAYIDWHYAGDTSVDYTTRLIEGSKGILTLKGGLIIDNTLSVGDDVEFKKRAFIKNYVTFSDLDAPGGSNSSTARIGTFDHNEGGIVIQLGKSGTGSNPIKQRFEIINPAWNVSLMSVDRNGNMLVNGGITMYSDQRKKTILNNVELSLKQIAEAPLIEHYYNSDEKKTTHVGSIAQYWASMNDWFCKLDSEGYYTMEIQNAALASAISIARELDRYETKTDKDIKKLKKRICELEEEVGRLKAS